HETVSISSRRMYRVSRADGERHADGAVCEIDARIDGPKRTSSQRGYAENKPDAPIASRAKNRSRRNEVVERGQGPLRAHVEPSVQPTIWRVTSAKALSSAAT